MRCNDPLRLRLDGNLESLPGSHLVEGLLVVLKGVDVRDHAGRLDFLRVEELDRTGETVCLGERADDAGEDISEPVLILNTICVLKKNKCDEKLRL